MSSSTKHFFSKIDRNNIIKKYKPYTGIMKLLKVITLDPFSTSGGSSWIYNISPLLYHVYLFQYAKSQYDADNFFTFSYLEFSYSHLFNQIVQAL